MKKSLLTVAKERCKVSTRLSVLLLSLILSLDLSGQKIQTMLTESWTSGNWQKSFQQVYTYDGSGYLINIITQTWDIPSTSWKNSTQSNYVNNLDGTASVVTNQIWDGVSAWTNSGKLTYTYNASKKVLTEVSENWVAGIWQLSLKETNTYDGNGNLTYSLFQIWDMMSSSWQSPPWLTV